MLAPKTTALQLQIKPEKNRTKQLSKPHIFRSLGGSNKKSNNQCEGPTLKVSFRHSKKRIASWKLRFFCAYVSILSQNVTPSMISSNHGTGKHSGKVEA